MPVLARQRRPQMPILVCVPDRVRCRSVRAADHPDIPYADEKGEECEDYLCFHGSSANHNQRRCRKTVDLQNFEEIAYAEYNHYQISLSTSSSKFLTMNFIV